MTALHDLGVAGPGTLSFGSAASRLREEKWNMALCVPIGRVVGAADVSEPMSSTNRHGTMQIKSASTLGEESGMRNDPKMKRNADERLTSNGIGGTGRTFRMNFGSASEKVRADGPTPISIGSKRTIAGIVNLNEAENSVDSTAFGGEPESERPLGFVRSNSGAPAMTSSVASVGSVEVRAIRSITSFPCPAAVQTGPPTFDQHVVRATPASMPATGSNWHRETPPRRPPA